MMRVLKKFVLPIVIIGGVAFGVCKLFPNVCETIKGWFTKKK